MIRDDTPSADEPLPDAARQAVGNEDRRDGELLPKLEVLFTMTEAALAPTSVMRRRSVDAVAAEEEVSPVKIISATLEGWLLFMLSNIRASWIDSHCKSLFLLQQQEENTGLGVTVTRLLESYRDGKLQDTSRTYYIQEVASGTTEKQFGLYCKPNSHGDDASDLSCAEIMRTLGIEMVKVRTVDEKTKDIDLFVAKWLRVLEETFSVDLDATHSNCCEASSFSKKYWIINRMVPFDELHLCISLLSPENTRCINKLMRLTALYGEYCPNRSPSLATGSRSSSIVSSGGSSTPSEHKPIGIRGRKTTSLSISRHGFSFKFRSPITREYFANVNFSLSNFVGSPPDFFKLSTSASSQSAKTLDSKTEAGGSWDRRRLTRKRKRRFGDFCSISEAQLAEFLTLKTYSEYQKLNVADMCQAKQRESSTAVQNMVDLFNKTSQWVVGYVLFGDTCLAGKDKSRKNRKENPRKYSANFEQQIIDKVQRLEFILSLGFELRLSRNYHLLFAVLSGLGMPCLDWVFEFAKEKVRQAFKYLNRVVAEANNYMVYRADISKAREKPHIPFVGLTMKYLFMLETDSEPKKNCETSNWVNVSNALYRLSAIEELFDGQKHPYRSVLTPHTRNRIKHVVEVHLNEVKSCDELIEISRVEKEVITHRLVNNLESGGFM